MDEPDAPPSPRSAPARSRGVWLAIAAGVLVIAAATVGLVWNTADTATSAVDGREGTRTFAGVPDDLPAAVAPADAADVEGTVSRTGDDWSAAVTYVSDRDRDALSPEVDEALVAAGFTVRQRAYDDTVMQVIYDGEDGDVATVTYRTLEAGTGVAVVLVAP